MKRFIKLYSLFPNEYPDITCSIEIVRNISKEFDKVTKTKIIYAKKNAVVQARVAVLNEVVDTRPRVRYKNRLYTFSETKQVVTQDKVDNGAIIVTNPDGEEYLLQSKEKFYSRYKICDGGYQSVGQISPFKEVAVNCAIMTSWGEIQYCLKGSFLNVHDEKDIYCVTNCAFEKTYEVIEDNLFVNQCDK